MKRYLTILPVIACLFLALPAHASVSFVQATGTGVTYYNGDGYISMSDTFANPVTASDTIIVAVQTSATTAQTGCRDNYNATSSYHLIGKGNDTANGQYQELWYAPGITGGSGFTVTCSFPDVQYDGMMMAEYSGIGTLDTSSTANSSGSTSLTTGTSTTSHNGELIFGSFLTGQPGGTFTNGTGFTTEANEWATQGFAFEDMTQSTAGAVSATATQSPSEAYANVMATFTAGTSTPFISSFSASPTVVASAGTSTLSWNVTNASSVAITPGSFSTSTLIGSTTVNPTSTTTYTLTATNANGTSTATASVTVDTSTPTTPGSLSANAISNSQISLTWTSSTDSGGSGIAWYSIFRCQGSCTPTTLVATSSNPSYTDTGLTASTLYTYAVSATNGVGTVSATSSDASATTEATNATPVLVQHVATGMDQNGAGTFTIPLPNPAGAGNALIIGIQYASTGTISSVTDNEGTNTWVAGPTLTNGTYHQKMSLYYALDVASGTQEVSVTFTGDPQESQGVLSEFYNVAQVSAFDGSSSSTASTTAGSVATTAGNDLVYEWGADLSDTFHGTPLDGESGLYDGTSITAGSGFTLLSADLQVGSADQYEVQSTTGAIDPAFTPSGASVWGSLALALKSATAGTAPPAGIRIVHVEHTLFNGNTTPLQFPSNGDLLVALFSSANSSTVTGVTDNASDTWLTAASTLGEGAPGEYVPAQIFYAANASTSPTLSGINLTLSGPNGGANFLILYDITGAATSSVLDTATTTVGDQSSTFGNLTTTSLTPSTVNGLVFNITPIYFETINGIVGTSTYDLDSVVNSNDNGNPPSNLDEDNGYSHVYNATTSTLTFVYTDSGGAGGQVGPWGSAAAAFKAAPVATAPLPLYMIDSSSTDFFLRAAAGSIFGNSLSTDFSLFNAGEVLALPSMISTDFRILSGIIRPIFQPVKPAYTQIHYQWRNDNGSETGATSATGGVEDTPLTGLAQNTSIRVRMEITNDGGTILSYSPQSFQLQYGVQSSTCAGTTSWTTVGAAGSVWAMYNSSNLTDGQNTTDIATSTGGVLDMNHTFIVANAGVKTTTSTVATISVPSDSFIDMEFDIEALSSSTTGVPYCFRLTNSGATSNFVYSQYPQATLGSSQSITLTLNTSTVALPGLAPGIAVSATTTVTVNVTGASSGYTLSIQRTPSSSPSTLASGTIQFPDYTPLWAPSGSTCASGQGNGATSTGNTFSFRVASSGTTANYCSFWWGTSDSAGTAIYSGVPTTTQIIVNSTSSASQNGTTTVTILYSANAPVSQKATGYTGGVTITAIANP